MPIYPLNAQDRMKPPEIILLALIELLGLFMIARLWLKSKTPLVKRILWSVILLIPLIGPMMYGFVSLDPSAHGEDPGDHSSGGGVGDTGPH